MGATPADQDAQAEPGANQTIQVPQLRHQQPVKELVDRVADVRRLQFNRELQVIQSLLTSAATLLTDCHGNSYAINYKDPLGRRTMSVSIGVPYNMTAVRKPSNTIMVTENSAYNYASNPERGQRWHVDSRSNDLKCNFAFADGHVRFARVAKPSPPTPLYPNSRDYQWNP